MARFSDDCELLHFQSAIVWRQRSPIHVCGSSRSLIIHLSDLFVALGRSYFFFFCVHDLSFNGFHFSPLPPPPSPLSLLSTFLSHFLCFQRRTLVSPGALLTFSPPALSSLTLTLMCAALSDAQVVWSFTPTLLLFLRVIHPSFLCRESQTRPLHKKTKQNPAVLSGRPRDPAAIAVASGGEKESVAPLGGRQQG